MFHGATNPAVTQFSSRFLVRNASILNYMCGYLVELINYLLLFYTVELFKFFLFSPLMSPPKKSLCHSAAVARQFGTIQQIALMTSFKRFQWIECENCFSRQRWINQTSDIYDISCVCILNNNEQNGYVWGKKTLISKALVCRNSVIVDLTMQFKFKYCCISVQ